MRHSTAMRERLHLLSVFILNPANSTELFECVTAFNHTQFDEFVLLLDKHHVLLRVLKPLEEMAVAAGNSLLAVRARTAIDAERERIREALQSMEAVCAELESAGCPVVVIKTLEHWPDFGSDLDLFSNGDERAVVNVFRKKLGARSTTRCWGDYLSHKRSFNLPGAKTPAEIHISRLGQAGEHVELAKRIVVRRQPVQVESHIFQVAAAEERVIITSLERMYRHLYFRICDILNMGRLLRDDALAFGELQSVAEQSGIWPGVAACMKIVSDYISSYGGAAWTLPPQISSAQAITVQMLFERDGLWHFPVLPQGARLFAEEFAHAIRRGDLAASARLSLLPPLASVASLAYAVTGNSGRIW